MTSFKTDVLRLVFRVSNTKEENDGQYDFEVFMLIDKFPNTLYKRGQTTVKDCKFITKILIKAFGEEAFPDVVYRNKVDWESLKTVKLTANIEHVPHYKLEGILVADIDNVSPPASEEARAHNKTRAQMFFAHVNDKEYKSPEIGTKK